MPSLPHDHSLSLEYETASSKSSSSSISAASDGEEKSDHRFVMKLATLTGDVPSGEKPLQRLSSSFPRTTLVATFLLIAIFVSGAVVLISLAATQGWISSSSSSEITSSKQLPDPTPESLDMWVGPWQPMEFANDDILVDSSTSEEFSMAWPSFGHRVVSISENGRVVAVASPASRRIVVWVLSNSNNERWTRAAELTGSTGSSDYLFGSTVVLSGDAKTLAITSGLSESKESGLRGFAHLHIFRTDSESWNTFEEVPVLELESGGLGSGVALSHDGTRLLVGYGFFVENSSLFNGKQMPPRVSGSATFFLYSEDQMGKSYAEEARFVGSFQVSGNTGWNVASSRDGLIGVASSVLQTGEYEDCGVLAADSTPDHAEYCDDIFPYHASIRLDLNSMSWNFEVFDKNDGCQGHVNSQVALSGDGSVTAIVATCLRSTPDENLVRVTCFETNTGSEISRLDRRASTAEHVAIALSSDGETIALALDNTVEMLFWSQTDNAWHQNLGMRSRLVFNHTLAVSVALSSNGHVLAVAPFNDKVGRAMIYQLSEDGV